MLNAFLTENETFEIESYRLLSPNLKQYFLPEFLTWIEIWHCLLTFIDLVQCVPHLNCGNYFSVYQIFPQRSDVAFTI